MPLQPASIAGRLARLSVLFGHRPVPSFELGGRPPGPRRAKGVPDRNNPLLRCIVVRVDAETFQRLSRAADASGVSMTEAIRQLIKRGLAAGEGGKSP